MSIVGTYKITLGNTLFPMNTIIRDGNGNPVDLSDFDSVTYVMEMENGTVEVPETAVSAVHPTQVFTLDATNNWIYCEAHGVKVNDVWVPATTGSLSGTGLVAATRYKVVETDIDWLRVSLRTGGGSITVAGAGTGTHTAFVVGSVQVDFQSANVDTAGFYRLWIITTLDDEKKHWPENPGYIQIQISAVGN